MSFKALVYAYVLGGITFIPLLIAAAIAWSIYTSVPVADPDPAKLQRKKLADEATVEDDVPLPVSSRNDQPKPRKAWLTVRRTFEEKESDGSYVNMMRAYLDSRSKDPKRSRPKDMWYVVLKGDVLFLYEDESMTECEAAIHLSVHKVVIYPEGLADGELFTKRNAICLKPLSPFDGGDKELPSVTREMGLEAEDIDSKVAELNTSDRRKEKERAKLEEIERTKAEAKAEAFDSSTPWFIFVRSCVEMEDWYLALVHAANYADSSSTLEPVLPVFSPSDMNHLVATLDEQPDVIPMRWLNALIGRIFFSFYRTKNLESFLIGRLMKKLSKVKIPSFLQNVSVTEVSVGNTPPTFSKPMLKDLTKEGDAALEIHVMYKGEVRVTVEATAIINLGQRFKTYTVKLVLAVVLRKLSGNLLVKVKRPPTNRIWYAFTHPPEMHLDVEPVVSDRQIKWGMICSTIESRLKEIINESVVMPNMDDIAFFESSRYVHRGGIWADASREAAHEKENGTDPNNTASTKARSTDNLAEVGATTMTEGIADADIDRAETASAPILLQDPSQRRSWFGNISGASTQGESESEMFRTGPSEQQQNSDDDRGRSLNVDSPTRRAASVPASKSSPVEALSTLEEDLHSGPTIAADSPQDGASTHSRIRSMSSGANALESEQSAPSHESMSSRPSNTSFLSALKQKADKQALSNTAKEAMRKWGASWNGFKRERMSGSHRREDTDTASGMAQSSTGSAGPSSRNRTYSEIRASVAGRKENSLPEGPLEDNPSQPINIPGKDKEPEDSGSLVGSSSSSNKDSEPSVPSSPQLSPKAPSLLRKEAARSPISPPRVTTDTIVSTDDTPSGSTSALPPPESPLQPQPIRTQPSQGATMTIPGIHVSHKGDIQSYGFVSPLASESKTRTATITPTIQSMYRLFRSPTSNSSVLQQQQQEGRPPQTPTPEMTSPARSEGSSPASEANDDVAPLSLTPSLSAPTDTREEGPQRRSPPPLPPRSGRSLSPTPPRLPPRRDAGITSGGNIGTAPSASDALRAIAEQDDTKRRDIETSPELRPKGSPSTTKAKRTSLGARRITTPVVFSEEPEDLSTGSEVEKSDNQGEPLVGPVTRTEAVATPNKPKPPPPLPPRRSSIHTNL